MSNIYVEAKGPKGVNAKESLLPAAVSGYTRGLAVTYGTDQYRAALVAIAGAVAVGILEEDAISTKNPCSVIEFGQAVAEIGANIAALQLLAVNASGQLVPAQPGQAVVAVALEPQTYVSPGSFANVFVLGLFGFRAPGSPVAHITAAGAIPLTSGAYGLGSGGALAMTLATPTAAQDGTELKIFAETAHAHTVTTAADIINGADDTVTFAAVGDTVTLIAVGGKWLVQSLKGATLSEV
jgi:hypothetical protein